MSIKPIKGAGQILKVFEKEITYITTKNVEPDDEDGEFPGYVTGSRNEEYDLKAAVVPQTEKQLVNLDYGDEQDGDVNVYIRTKNQDIEELKEGEEIVINEGDYFNIDGNEWKILTVNNYDTVIICSCGRSKGGGYPIES